MTRTVRLLFAASVMSLLLAAPMAYAGEPQLVERRVQTVTGVDVALDALGRMRGVELGSEGATLTIETAGGRQQVPFTLGALRGAGQDPYAGLALLAFACSTIARAAGTLSRLLG